jgi:hypothetical protein
MLKRLGMMFGTNLLLQSLETSCTVSLLSEVSRYSLVYYQFNRENMVHLPLPSVRYEEDRWWFYRGEEEPTKTGLPHVYDGPAQKIDGTGRFKYGSTAESDTNAGPSRICDYHIGLAMDYFAALSKEQRTRLVHMAAISETKFMNRRLVKDYYATHKNPSCVKRVKSVISVLDNLHNDRERYCVMEQLFKGGADARPSIVIALTYLREY